MPTITCPNCRKALESGPDYCPHCFLKLPGIVRPHPPAPSPRAVRAVTRHQERAPRAPAARSATTREVKPAGQCPACSHPITTKDEWCKWCHWPVNRKV